VTRSQDGGGGGCRRPLCECFMTLPGYSYCACVWSWSHVLHQPPAAWPISSQRFLRGNLNRFEDPLHGLPQPAARSTGRGAVYSASRPARRVVSRRGTERSVRRAAARGGGGGPPRRGSRRQRARLAAPPAAPAAERAASWAHRNSFRQHSNIRPQKPISPPHTDRGRTELSPRAQLPEPGLPDGGDASRGTPGGGPSAACRRSGARAAAAGAPAIAVARRAAARGRTPQRPRARPRPCAPAA
jgi:hypothetical protein